MQTLQTGKEIELNQLAEAEAFLQELKTNPEGVEYSIMKKEYINLLDNAFEKAESNIYWAGYIVPALLELNILDKSDKEKYMILLDRAFEKAESKDSWAEYIVPALLKLNILDKSDKEKYMILLDRAFEKAESKDS
ncbi:MAG TPA: hypothetical protein P5155_03055, partial [Candidatus Absconditabacterales bacterium]|nr:hypothetical protein [Candidatus Absconditabacterales bacterium]